ncbi:MAG: hypothetical protein AB1578_21405, partial [Thermodesulfobacteriota bacterium]
MEEALAGALFWAAAAVGVILVRLTAWRAVCSLDPKRLRHWGKRTSAGRFLRVTGRAVRQDHPGSWRVLAARLSPGRFTGLPLTLLCLVGVGLALLLLGLAEEVLKVEGWARLDRAVHGALGPHRTSPIVPLLTAVTGFGDGVTLLAVSLVAGGVLWSQGRGAAVLPLWIVLAGAQATVWLGKYAFGRPRPDLGAVTLATPAFPSAHAAGAAAVYGFLAFLVARDLKQARARFEVAY